MRTISGEMRFIFHPLAEGPLVITGGCLCREIHFEAAELPRATHYCHCSMCRRATGSSCAVIVWFRKAAVQWKTVKPARYASSRIASRFFCPHCGTPVCLEYNDSEEVGFMVGCLDDPDQFAPTYHYGTESRLRWCDAGGALPEGQVTREVLE